MQKKETESKLYKYYVDVDCRIDEQQRITPLSIIWDQKVYEIEQILSQREAFSESGGAGIQFICRFRQGVRTLFLERDRWFVESRRFYPQKLVRFKT